MKHPRHRRLRQTLVLVIIAIACSGDHVALGEDSRRVEIQSLMAEGARLHGIRTALSIDSATMVWDSARALATTYFGPLDSAVAAALTRLAACYHWKADRVTADSLARKGIEVYEAALGKDHPVGHIKKERVRLIYLCHGCGGISYPFAQWRQNFSNSAAPARQLIQKLNICYDWKSGYGGNQQSADDNTQYQADF